MHEKNESLRLFCVFRVQIKIFASLRLCVCCFRHLEKPIKTKENKRKHFVFICFYWFCSVFLEGESKFFKRRDAKAQSFFFFSNTDYTDQRDMLAYARD